MGRRGLVTRLLRPWSSRPGSQHRPVHNFAHAMRITHAEIVAGEDGRKTMQCQAHGLALTPVPVSQQVMVIRPD